MENLDIILDLVMKHDWFVSIDLTDAYFSIPIAEEHRKYLRFAWENQFYQFNVLCFGLASAPRVFTKCTKPFISTLREKGIRLSIYIDDIIIMNQCPLRLKMERDQALHLLTSLGFQVNLTKSKLEPCQSIEHLGFAIDSNNMTVALPQSKCRKIEKLSNNLLLAKTSTIRQVATLVGHFNAYTTGTKWGRLFIRKLEQNMTSSLHFNKGKFDKTMLISHSARQEIKWWLSDKKLIPRPISITDAVLHIFSDASQKGWGAHNIEGLSTGGRWTTQEATNHINWLELKACFLGLQSLAAKLCNATIKVSLDSTVAVNYINSMGGKISSLNAIATDIWAWCQKRNAWLLATHIAGKANVLADNRSRIFHDATEWSLRKNEFELICKTFGHPNIDLFASRLNSKCDTYFSWEPDPHSKEVDAFSVNWNNLGSCYAFPPFNLIGKVIQKMIRDQVEDLFLVAPKWPSQHWYPLIMAYRVQDSTILEFKNSPKLLHLPYDHSKTHAIWNKLNLCCFRLSSRH